MEVYRNPVDTFVAGFLATPPMNLLPGRIEGGAAGCDGGDRRLPAADPDRTTGRPMPATPASR